MSDSSSTTERSTTPYVWSCLRADDPRLTCPLSTSQAVLEKLSKHLETKGGKVIHFDELRSLGKFHPGDFSKKPARDDTFCIMYTSGSTGTPKGVILSHGNIVSSLGGTLLLLSPILKPDDTFLAFLPLSHILEMLVELTFYAHGTLIGYGGVKTLTDASVRKCEGDLKAFKPSIIVGVREFKASPRHSQAAQSLTTLLPWLDVSSDHL